MAEGRGLEPLRAFARLFSRQVPYHSAQPSLLLELFQYSLFNLIFQFYFLTNFFLDNVLHNVLALSLGLPILYFTPVLYLFEQALLQVPLFNPAKINFPQTKQGFSFLHLMPAQITLQKTFPLFISTGLL